MRAMVMVLLLACACPAVRPALGQTYPAPGAKGDAVAAPTSPSVRSDQDAMKTMMGGMEIPLTGDADQDFVSQMEPHHQGAIDMAEAELKYGSDPKLKQLAARIIAAQQHEIAFMQAWQAKHPPALHSNANGDAKK